MRPRIEVLHCFCQHMRVIVPRQFKRIGLVTRRDQRKRGIAFQRAHDVAHFAINPRRNRSLRKPRPDARGNIGRRRAMRDFAHGTIGKSDFKHR